MLLKLGHSPDPDDAFMFYALAHDCIDTEGLQFEHILQDIETLNQRAAHSELDITALSVHAYAYLHDRYQLLPHGASMGDGYGPVFIARTPMPAAKLHGARIAVPGLRTSAYLAARLAVPEFEPLVVPFDAIMEHVRTGQCDVGLLIHEGQLTYAAEGFHKVLDLGEWWRDVSGGLPLPLGVNAVRRDLPAEVKRRLLRVLGASIHYALAHRAPAVQHALQWGRGLDTPTADRFIGMYVNELTEDLGERGRAGIREFLSRGAAAGLVPGPIPVDFVTA
jgi:1,4-dihydroxy-6-naphthoate synthase